MKKIPCPSKPWRSWMLLLFVICLSAKGFSQQKKYSISLIGFYNLENLFDTIDGPNNDAEFLPGGANHYTGEVYKDKLGKLTDVISLIGTDQTPDGLAVMGVAEVENKSVLEDLVKQPKIESRHYKIVHYDSPDERGIDVALLYNPKYFEPKHSESLFVELFNDDKTPRYTRDILYVYGLLAGEPIHIMVGHWPSRRGGEELSAPGRAKAAGVCRHKADSIIKTNPDAKIIIMGDLNDDPINHSVAVVLKAKTELKDVKKSGMYNPWMRYYKEGIGTLAYNDAWNLFDQIIISQGWLNKKQQGYFYNDSKIFRKPWMENQSGRYKGYPKRTYDFSNYIGGYSDHFPTYIVLLKEQR